ncbi:MAG: site-specific DNA-methyltransferase [archaeon]|nr:site-specific DNA-methyltransferase [archaeon]
MATNTKKDKFYSVLKNIFIGAKIEGNSGYVNLMRIKNRYYQDFKGQLATDIDKKLDEVGRNFEEELYNKLYTFFKKYFSESGSIYFSYTPLQEKVYERIYRDDKDVMLFWKTNMLYYVKTERLYQNMDIQDEDNQIWYYFDVSELEHKKSNEKKELIFEYDKSWHKDNKREIFFKVKYSKNGSKTKIEDILKKVKKSTKALGAYKEQELKRAFGIFRKQSEVDYFINKNAKEFLQEQFSLWIKTYVFDDDTVFEEARLKQLKALRDISYNIIDLVSQFEDELVKIWNKPKFAHSSNYVITLDKIADKDFALLEKLLKHKGITEQIKEWKELGIADDKFEIKELTKDKILNKIWQYLPLDTKYFKDLEIDILALFDDLDNQLDGWLIHSENYQALNTLKRKFYKKIDTIYIDPPYNAQSSEIIYVNNYKDSSWLTLMENRISISKRLLSENGANICAIDEVEQEELGLLINEQFKRNYENTCITVINNPSGQQGDNFSNTHEYLYFSFPNKKGRINLEIRDEEDADIRNFRDVTGDDSLRTAAKNCFYPIFVKDDKIVGFGDVCDEDYHPNSVNEKDDDIIAIYPIDPEGVERKWRFARQTVESIKDELFVHFLKQRDVFDIKRNKKRFNYKTVWTDSKYSSNNYGSQLLNNIMGEQIFDYPKSLYAVYESLNATSGNNKEAIILDYFPGSGTTAHAIIELNKNDKGNRKFVLTELGDHFSTAIIPRIKKISFTDKWQKGKAKGDGKGYSNFFKYYELEQYEEALRNAKYEDKGALPKDIYHQYLFFKDLKLADEVVKLDGESKSIMVDLTKLHNKIDIPETLSFLTGKFIKQILKDKVVFTDGSEIEYANIDYKIVKPLIWW